MDDPRAAMVDNRIVQGQACREAGAQLDSANTMTGTVAPDVCQVDTVNAAGSHRRLDTDNSALIGALFPAIWHLLDAMPWGGRRKHCARSAIICVRILVSSE